MCCCFSQKLLQILLCIFSLIVVGAGAYVIVFSTQFGDLAIVEVLEEEDDVADILDLIEMVLFYTGIGVCVFGLIGLLGGIFKWKILLSIYAVIAFILGVVFLAIGAGALYAYSNFLPDTFSVDEVCTGDDSVLKSVDDAYAQAANTICTEDCPCYIAPETNCANEWGASTCSGFITSSGDDGAVKVNQCNPCVHYDTISVETQAYCLAGGEAYAEEVYEENFGDYENYFDLLEFVEEE